MQIKKISGILVVALLLTSCTSSDVSNDLPRSEMSYDELVKIPGYKDLLNESCDSDLENQLSTLAMFNIDGSSSSIFDVLKSRTSRILESIGDDKAESGMLNEIASWGKFVGNERVNSWQNPGKAFAAVVDDSAKENLYSNLFQSESLLDGDSPKDIQTASNLVSDWIDACNLRTVYDKARSATDAIDKAVIALSESFENRLLEKGYTDYGVGFAKAEVVGNKVKFNYVQVGCWLQATVTYEGKPDEDGVTPEPFQDNTVLSLGSDFTELEDTEPIHDSVTNQPKMFDIGEGSLTQIECLS